MVRPNLASNPSTLHGLWPLKTPNSQGAQEAKLMNTRVRRTANATMVWVLSSALTLFAEPLPQSAQQTDQSSPAQVSDTSNEPPPMYSSSKSSNTSTSTLDRELPDAPTPAQPVQQSQNDPPQQQNPASVPSGAAGAKAPTVKGAPASRPVGAAIAPAKQRQRRSLLIKAGLIAGACVAVGSAFALSKASPSKPPGAP